MDGRTYNETRPFNRSTKPNRQSGDPLCLFAMNRTL